jgi:hypothetical protein
LKVEEISYLTRDMMGDVVVDVDVDVKIEEENFDK